MDELAIILCVLALLALLGFAWDVTRVVRRADFRGLSIAAIVVRAIGPVAGFVAYSTYDRAGNKFGILSAVAKGVGWALPFIVAAIVLELILLVALMVARCSRSPASE